MKTIVLVKELKIYAVKDLSLLLAKEARRWELEAPKVISWNYLPGDPGENRSL